MKIDYPTPELVPQLRSLWREAFGDDGAFLDLFFDHVYSSDRCRCVTVDGKVAAALYWLDCRCQNQPVAYIYAVATGEKYRHQGHCWALMMDTHKLLTALGYAAAVLVPGEPKLFAMYRAMGYQVGSTIREFTAEAGPARTELRQLSTAEYAAARREFLPDKAVIQEGENLIFLSKMAKFYRGPDFLLCVGDGEITGLELLGNADAAPGILAALGRETGIFRTPGPGRDFAMYRAFAGEMAPGYLGFAFD